MNNKNDKKSVKILHKSKTETSPNLSLDSNDDLLAAIKQVAKEMAEAVKKTEKEIEKTRQETERKENETKHSIYISKLSVSIQNEIEERNDRVPPAQATSDTPSKPKASSAVLSPPDMNPIYSEESVEHPNIEEAEEDDLQEEHDTYPRYEDYKLGNYEIETDYIKKSFYERNVEAYNKFQQKLELQRSKKISEEMKYMQSKPQLTQATKKIIQKKLPDYEPIYNRVDEEIFKRNQKLDFLKFSLADMERSKESHNVSKFNTGYADKEQIGNFIKTQTDWKKKRDDKVSNIKNEIEKFEDEASKYLFQPAILKSSELIAQNKIRKDKDKEVHKRLYNLHEENLKKKKKMEMKSLPSFKPNINRNYPNYLKRIERDLAAKEMSGDGAPIDMWEDAIGNKQVEDSAKFCKNKNTRSIPKISDEYSVSDRLDDSNDNNLNKIPKKFNEHMSKADSKNNQYKEKPHYDREDQSNEDAIIKAYKESLDELYSSSNNTNPVPADTYKVYSIGENRLKKAAESNWRYAIPKLSPAVNDIVTDDGFNNFYKINIQDKGDNKVVATPQFATMIKKNFNIIANAKMKQKK